MLWVSKDKFGNQPVWLAFGLLGGGEEVGGGGWDFFHSNAGMKDLGLSELGYVNYTAITSGL